MNNDNNVSVLCYVIEFRFFGVFVVFFTCCECCSIVLSNKQHKTHKRNTKSVVVNLNNFLQYINQPLTFYLNLVYVTNRIANVNNNN